MQPECRCQKQPSTNTASRDFGKMKSGLPNNLAFRRQPDNFAARNNIIIRSSVFLFPLARIRAMTALRFAGSKTSGIFR